MDTVAATIERVLADVPGSEAIPTEPLSQAISALFLGIELLDDLDPSRFKVDELFDTLEGLARVIESVMQTPLLQAFGAAPAEKS